ncbi:uncharacterized protein LOC128998165 [Macrosteles quadrilineatus]|uniref:uncharacterized protein LOC128998165 n=1 Tax=Macrosteles quadrilineatus TaxID=74068 RepID=UPI0023E2FDE8|nr:uncharacterized protein LOC128998165 [Macrosteles quadrilineatus]
MTTEMTPMKAMGCGGSSNNKSQRVSGHSLDTLDTFLRLDRDIWREERSAPAPSLGHYIARLERLNTEIEVASTIPNIDIPGAVETFMPLPARNSDSSEEAIQKAVVELQINQNPKHATEHEEFIANLTRQALRLSRLNWLKKRKQDTEEEINRLSEKVQYLQGLYEQLDSLFGNLGGGVLSDLELQLDRVRSYRDTLYSGELSWREAARLTQVAATLAMAGRDSWLSLDNTTNVVTRFRVATDCRNAIQEAVLCIQTAQTTLPGVLFPYCTMREIAALLQMIVYIYTDLQIPERFSHALDVYSSFQKRSSLLSNWIRQMMDDTIHKDVEDVDQRILELSARLSNERANLVRTKIGLRSKRLDGFPYMNDGRLAASSSNHMTPRKHGGSSIQDTDYNALLWK